ncbi:gag-pol polyprotein [Cucumis melo var. makuwa]|uniref:Gag-pol polyprotein n=1 Tax=Cucumis melo var. makuwa TaxID=1194695 RepID=A0A5A7TJC1_CUCMM|nr:gag-pol polyprotein [Cucumis melo var. makuwa]
MTEEETIAEFNVRFNMKVTTIEEVNDLSKMKLDELFGSLRTFELHLEEDYERGEKDYGTSKFEKNSKGIRCHECEGFGHIQSECTTYLKCKKKSLVATLSDEENYLESDDEEVGIALISSIILNEEGMENEISQVPDQQATMSNKSLNEITLKRKWEEDQATIVYQQERIQYLMEENQSFLSSIVTLKAELKEARNQFEELSKSVKMMTGGTHKLDDLLGQGKRCNDKRGLGFSEIGYDRTKKIVFVHESNSYDDQRKITKEKRTEDTTPSIKSLNRRKRWICYFCGKIGHIRPYCYQLQSLLYQKQVSNQSKHINRHRTEWRPKVNMENCKVALTSVYNPNSTNQYVDSGCSSHMTGNASFFFELSECNARLVMFSDGEKGRIVRIAIIGYNYSSVHTMVVTRVKSYQSTIFALVHHSFASFESSHMTPIDVVGTAPIVICLSMFLFQGSHIPDVSAEFDNASSDSRASSAVSPTVGQPLVLSVTCVHALMVESLSLTGQISKFSV